jgi:lipopolysaccharide assembly outer membrane protein LptD (OstA)
MSGGALKPSSLLPGVALCLLLYTLSPTILHTDAYLSEDRIYYGADSYRVNYKDEIINARGNAFFRRDDFSIHSREVVIYYGEDKKKATFHGDVVMRDVENRYQLYGDYGEAYFREERFLVLGNVVFINDTRRITAQRGETRGMKNFTFSETVEFSDTQVTIMSQTLEVQQDNTVVFRDDVRAEFIESGDVLYSRVLTYDVETGDSEFRGDVIYMQGMGTGTREKNTQDGGQVLVRSEVARYISADSLLLLMENVYVTDGEYSLRAPMIKYFKERNFLESVGDTVIFDGRRTLYCDRMELDLETQSLEFFGSIQGVLELD